MKQAHLSTIFKNHVSNIIGMKQAQCAICGNISDALPLKSVLSANFNDWQYLKYNSEYICIVCSACLASDGINGKALRNYSIIANPDKLIIISQSQIHDYIILPLAPPFIFLVSFTKKKHIFLHAKINYSTNQIYIATDKQDICIDVNEYKYLYDTCNVLYDVGFSKIEIETGQYKKLSLLDEIDRFWDHDLLISKFRNQFILQFTLYTLTKETDGDKN